MPRKGHPVFLCQNKMKPISVVAFMSSYNKKDRKKKKKELLRREKAARKSRYTKRMNREEKFYEKVQHMSRQRVTPIRKEQEEDG